jgi:hypothetical protein
MQTTPEQLASYQWCADWMSAIDRYAGLIVGMHRTGLWRARYDTIAHPPQAARAAPPEIDAYIARNEPRQASERGALGESQVWTNYRLLQVWDLLGLYFCCQDPYDDFIEPVPVAYGSKRNDDIRITLTPKDPRTVAFDPYPFDVRPCHVQLGFRRMPQTAYPDQESFRRAYFQADIDLMRFTLV